jgi:hypothetical protein
VISALGYAGLGYAGYRQPRRAPQRWLPNPWNGCVVVGRGFAEPVEHFGLLTYGPRA